MPERKIQYFPIINKAHPGLEVTAPSMERLYVDAALSLTDMMSRLDTIEVKDKQSVDVAGENRDALMANWLNEILQLFEKKRFLAKRIVFNKFDGKKISASLHGETHVPTKHGSASLLKAVTKNEMVIGERTQPEICFFARIFFGE